MNSIFLALEQLRTQLSQALPAAPGIRHFDVSFPLNDAFDPLAWLGEQQCYPQFYWQQRNGDEELAALGAVNQFSSLALASQFLREQNAAQDTRVCGLNAFNPEQGSLFLPRLLWRRTAGNATLRLQLWSDRSLVEDARAALDFLQRLRPAKSIRPLSVQVEHETHQPQQAEWLKLIRRATETIARGEFEKVVLARATDLQFTQRVNPVALMAASRALNLHCYHFCMVFDASNAFLGSTPERLWRRRGKLLRTEALAGTVASHTEDSQAQRLGEWLLNDDKNQRENMLVVEDICQRLQHSTQTLEVLPPRWYACVRCSICAAVSGQSSNRPTTSSVCSCCSRPRPLPDYPDSPRVSLSRRLNPLTASGMPVRPGTYPPNRVSSAWHCAPRAFRRTPCGSTPVPVLSAGLTRSRSGRRLKIKPPDCALCS